MRIVAEIPHPKFKITVFAMNDKYVIKIEAGPMEQTYKFTQDEVGNESNIEKLLDDDFMQGVYDRFHNMFVDMQSTIKRNS